MDVLHVFPLSLSESEPKKKPNSGESETNAREYFPAASESICLQYVVILTVPYSTNQPVF